MCPAGSSARTGVAEAAPRFAWTVGIEHVERLAGWRIGSATLRDAHGAIQDIPLLVVQLVRRANLIDGQPQIGQTTHYPAHTSREMPGPLIAVSPELLPSVIRPAGRWNPNAAWLDILSSVLPSHLSLRINQVHLVSWCAGEGVLPVLLDEVVVASRRDSSPDGGD